MNETPAAPKLSVVSGDADALPANGLLLLEPATLQVTPLPVIALADAGQPAHPIELAECVRSGDTVVEIGLKAGALCHQAALLAGPTGRVIAIEPDPETLSAARRERPRGAAGPSSSISSTLEFRRGMYHDLQLDLDRLDAELANRPVATASAWMELRTLEDRLRREQPLIADASVDCVVSQSALNRLQPQEQERFFHELFRVLRVGGRAVISDLVADEEVSATLHDSQPLQIAGALCEDHLLQAFEKAGFHGIEILHRDRQPRHTLDGIEFRSLTVSAWKGKQGVCLERNQALIYRGPFKQVEDDDGHVFPRGARMAVCDKTFRLLTRAPYGAAFVPVEPNSPIPLELAGPFDCSRSEHRAPRETKRPGGLAIIASSSGCCEPDGNCC